eukprot:Opistho-2@95857
MGTSRSSVDVRHEIDRDSAMTLANRLLPMHQITRRGQTQANSQSMIDFVILDGALRTANPRCVIRLGPDVGSNHLPVLVVWYMSQLRHLSHNHHRNVQNCRRGATVA